MLDLGYIYTHFHHTDGNEGNLGAVYINTKDHFESVCTCILKNGWTLVLTPMKAPPYELCPHFFVLCFHTLCAYAYARSPLWYSLQHVVFR